MGWSRQALDRGGSEGQGAGDGKQRPAAVRSHCRPVKWILPSA